MCVCARACVCVKSAKSCWRRAFKKFKSNKLASSSKSPKGWGEVVVKNLWENSVEKKNKKKEFLLKP